MPVCGRMEVEVEAICCFDSSRLDCFASLKDPFGVPFFWLFQYLSLSLFLFLVLRWDWLFCCVNRCSSSFSSSPSWNSDWHNPTKAEVNPPCSTPVVSSTALPATSSSDIDVDGRDPADIDAQFITPLITTDASADTDDAVIHTSAHGASEEGPTLKTTVVQVFFPQFCSDINFFLSFFLFFCCILSQHPYRNECAGILRFVPLMALFFFFKLLISLERTIPFELQLWILPKCKRVSFPPYLYSFYLQVSAKLNGI